MGYNGATLRATGEEQRTPAPVDAIFPRVRKLLS